VSSTAAKRKTRVAGSPGRLSTTVPTREVILDTAERLFAARGVDGVAVRDLAAEMGITASSLYNHFPSKQTLYEAVVERGLLPITQVVTQSWQDAVSPDRVHETLDRLTAHLARHPDIARLLQRALLEESPTVQALIERWVLSLYRDGIAVVGKVARDAGWDAEEVPHLGVALFGMIFAYFGYLLFAGIFERRLGSMLLSLLVFFLWGGMLWSALPTLNDQGISWEGHLSGLAGGIIAAKLLAQRKAPPQSASALPDVPRF